MKRDPQAFSVPRFFVHLRAAVFLATPAACSLTGCVPAAANLQSARTIDKGQNRITPYAFEVDRAEDDNYNGQRKLANIYGFLLGWGTGDDSEFQLRFEHQHYPGEDDGVNFLSLGPKFSNARDNFAFVLPIGFYSATVIPAWDTVQIHPGFMGTAALGRYMELTGATKAIVPLQSPSFTWAAFSLGMSLSNDVHRWALMPEVVYMTNVGANDATPLVTYGVAVAFFSE